MMPRTKSQFPFVIHLAINDNLLAFSVVVISGCLGALAMLANVSENRSMAALAAGSSGISGVIGYIGGKNSVKRDSEDSHL